VSWLANGQVQIHGTVQDDSPLKTIVHLTGSVVADAHPDSTGQYTVQLTPVTRGALYVQAVDANGLASATQSMPAAMNSTPPSTSTTGPAITNIQITNTNGTWTISGTVENAPPGTVIQIGSTNPAWNGRTATVDGPDGGFSIGFTPTTGDPGGTIGITAETPDGLKSDTILQAID
jgi:hypothetical protein